ncbi:hypothetical protein NC652_002402 [Populus alba x Populus x berolinensis]|nr:hypothetical protein NC652_002402 [Populus alba x Populus x berolinensis]
MTTKALLHNRSKQNIMRMSLMCKQKGQSPGMKRSLTAISRGLPVNPKLQQPKSLKQWGRKPHPTCKNSEPSTHQPIPAKLT